MAEIEVDEHDALAGGGKRLGEAGARGRLTLARVRAGHDHDRVRKLGDGDEQVRAQHTERLPRGEEVAALVTGRLGAPGPEPSQRARLLALSHRAKVSGSVLETPASPEARPRAQGRRRARAA